MLQNIRDGSQGFLAKAIIAVIVLVFALFGVESIIGGFTTLPPVLEVNGEEINQNQLDTAIRREAAFFEGDPASPSQEQVEAFARSRLIQEALVRQSAEAAALSVPEAMVDQAILANPAFQVGGVYDRELAGRAIASMGYSVPLYREETRQNLLLSQVINAYSATNFVLDSELQSIAELLAQTRDFRYLPLTLGSRTTDTPVSPEEVAAYYDANPAQFTDEESVTVDYVLLDQEDIAAGIEVEEAALNALYEQERAEFEGSAERRASHILFELGGSEGEGEGEGEETALAAAAEARARIADGEDFAALALELSADDFSAQEGGDIGYSDGSAFPPEVEEALDALELDGVSEPVLSEFGVHLVKLTEAAEGEYPPFEELRERLEREAKAAEVESLYASRLTDMSNLAFESGDLQPLADELGLEIRQSEPFGRSGGLGVFAEPEVIETAFSDAVFLDGNNSDVVELSDSRALVLRLLQSTPATLRTLEEAEPEISVLLRAEMEREAVRELGEALFAALQAGESLQTIDERLAEDGQGVEWIAQEAARRNAPDVNPQVLGTAFAMRLPTPAPAPAADEETDEETDRDANEETGLAYDRVTLPNGTFAIIELSAVTPGSLDDLSTDEQTLFVEEMGAELGNSDLGAYINHLQRTATIRDLSRPEPLTN